MFSFSIYRHLYRCKIESLRYLRLFSCTVPDIDVDYYCNIKNLNEIKNNIEIRKGVGDIDKVLHLYNSLNSSSQCHENLKLDLLKQLSILPNKTHPTVLKYKGEPRIIHEINKKRDFGNHTALEFSDITERLNIMRTDKLGNTCGNKSYYYLGALAELEEALIKYTVSSLLSQNFLLVSVPDILPSKTLESCGMTVNSNRTQIYSLDPTLHGDDKYLSGTAEMSLAGLLSNTTHPVEELPLKLAAVSRCFRAETSNVIEERGIYRVHQFTKVEMFVVSAPDQSDDMLEYLRNIQESLFTPLGFHMRILDMPPHELGAPAYRKYDIEAWMPGRKSFGEISSCSNCTDYQSRRLHIKYKDSNAEFYVHTLNGTACAVPRMLIALLETHQNPKGKVHIPQVLQPFLNCSTEIVKNNKVPKLKLKK
ncbi:serine--tRNA ligase, mitochondrial [Battus philenor]|uniref:serine--tRNA ligase, mitochondrial n=1 Tax=Battus philenor TaxID=42288 RepID=UPI0035CF164A